MAKAKEYYADVEYDDFPDEEYGGFTDSFPDEEYDDCHTDCGDVDTGYFPDDSWPETGDEFPAEVVPTYKQVRKAS